jgi:hypothetical protein
MNPGLEFKVSHLGCLQSYGYQPAEYISAFRSVHDAVKNNTDANATYMVWSPNIFGGSVDNPLQGYTPYYPGKDCKHFIVASVLRFQADISLRC